jgi:ABC-2 type transport system permease protein
MKRNAWVMPDAISGALYLLAGTIFPIAILPGWLEKIALGMPLTYWLELIRRALLGDAVGATFPIASTLVIVGLLALTTVLALIVCFSIFRICNYLARERGQIDRTTGGSQVMHLWKSILNGLYST